MMLENRLPFLTGALKKQFLRIIFSGLVLGAMVALLIAPSKVQGPEPRDGHKISLLVEKGFVMPPQTLAILKSHEASRTATSNRSTRVIFDEAIELPRQSNMGWSFNTTFTISGDARVESQHEDGLMAVMPTDNGVIKTPAIVASPRFGESFIQGLVDGQPIVENLRMATLDVGDIESLREYAPAGDPALMVSGDHYAVLDESNRIHWGWNVALKAPDSCTVDWYADGSWSYCCNAAAWAAGKHIVWLYNNDLPREGFLGCHW